MMMMINQEEEEERRKKAVKTLFSVLSRAGFMGSWYSFVLYGNWILPFQG